METAAGDLGQGIKNIPSPPDPFEKIDSPVAESNPPVDKPQPPLDQPKPPPPPKPAKWPGLLLLFVLVGAIGVAGAGFVKGRLNRKETRVTPRLNLELPVFPKVLIDQYFGRLSGPNLESYALAGLSLAETLISNEATPAGQQTDEEKLYVYLVNQKIEAATGSAYFKESDDISEMTEKDKKSYYPVRKAAAAFRDLVRSASLFGRVEPAVDWKNNPLKSWAVKSYSLSYYHEAGGDYLLPFYIFAGEGWVARPGDKNPSLKISLKLFAPALATD